MASARSASQRLGAAGAILATQSAQFAAAILRVSAGCCCHSSGPLRRPDNTAKRSFVLAPHELRPITKVPSDRSDDSSDASDASDDALTKLQLDALAQLQQLRPGDARARPRVRLLRRRSSPILPEPVRV